MERMECSASQGLRDEGRARMIPWIEAVNKELSPENQIKIRESCFGNILRIPAVRLQDDLYLQLLLIIDQTSRCRDTLAFKVRDKSFTFSASDFSLVTGLRFTPLPATPTSSVFHSLIFDGRADLCFDDIQRLFIAECKGRGGAGQICYKLGLLVIVYGVIVFRRGNSIIDNRYIHLIDDAVAFDRFPWGRLAFEHLIESTKVARDRLGRFINADFRPQFETPGYSYALQVWAYEVMPSVGRLCANRILGWECKLPRVMRWVPISVVPRVQITDLFSAADLEVCTPIQDISNDEQVLLLMNYNRTRNPPSVDQTCFESPVLQFHTGLNVIKRKLSFGDHCEEKTGKSSSLAKFDIGGLIATNPGCCSGSSKRTYIMKSAPRHVEAVKATGACGVKMDSIVGPQEDTCFDFKKGKMRCMSDLVLEVSRLQLRVSEISDMLLTSKSVPSRKGTASEDPVSIPSHPLQVDKMCQSSSSDSSFYLDPPKKKRNGVRLILLDDDSVDIAPNDEGSIEVHPSFKGFIEWYRRRGLHGQVPHVPLPTLWSVGVSTSWFDPLLNPDGWLVDEHMDAIAALIVIEARMKDELLGRSSVRWSILDTACWGALKQCDRKILYEQTLPYVRGARPAMGACPWSLVDKIYGFGHVHEIHWLLYEISIQDQRVTVYDSLSAKLYWPIIASELKYFVRNIPWLLSRLNVNVIKIGKLKNKWDLVQYKHPPQQKNNADCGVLDLKYMQCLVNRTPFSVIVPARASDYRKNFCGQLFEYGLNTLKDKGRHAKHGDEVELG